MDSLMAPDDAWRTCPDNHGTAVVYSALQSAPKAIDVEKEEIGIHLTLQKHWTF